MEHLNDIKFIKTNKNVYLNPKHVAAFVIEQNKIIAYYPFKHPNIGDDEEEWAFWVIEEYENREKAQKSLDILMENISGKYIYKC